MGTWRFHNVTTNADFWPVLNSISVTNQQPCELATFTGRIVGSDDLTEEDEVQVLYAADDVTFVKFFAGNISVLTLAHIEPIAEPAVYEFSARDFTATLDDSGQGTLGNRNVTENADDRVAWIMSQGNDFGITLSGVTETTPVGPFDYTSMSHREALAQVAGVVGAVLYVDFDKDLQFYDAESVIPAPFDLATPASPTSSYPYRAFRLDHDSTDRADAVVAYGQDNIFAVATRVGAPAANLRKRRAITTDLTNLADLTTAAEIEVDRIGTPQIAGSLTCWQPGLSSGQTVHIVNPTHAIDDDFIISQVSYSYTDTNPADVGEVGGSVVISVSFADRLLCVPRKDSSRSLTPIADCTDCSRTVAILPSGMDENLSLAEGRDGMFISDGTTLVKYGCDLNVNASATPSASDLIYIDHEPVYEAVLKGDAAVFTGTVGPFGDLRWGPLAAQVGAAKVMDIRKAWLTTASTAASFIDTFERTTSSPSLGTADTGETWAGPTGEADSSSAAVIGSATINADGDEAKYHGVSSSSEFEKTVRGSGKVWDLGNDWALQTEVRITWSGTANRLMVMGVGMNTEPVAVYLNQQSGGSWKFGMTWAAPGGGTDFTETTVSSGAFASGDVLIIYWRHQPGVTFNEVQLYGPGPSLITTLTETSTGTSAEEAALSHPGGEGFSIYAKGQYDIFWQYINMGSMGGGLERHDMTDGSLEASVTLTNPVYNLRPTPNRQHVFLDVGTTNDGPLQRYDRTPAAEGSPVSITDFYNDLQDFAADDAYNIYTLNANVLTRYSAAGASVWSVDLNAVYGYRFPSRMTGFGSAYGAGQTILISGAQVYVCGYIGGADWQSGGSQGTVLVLDRADGSLISQKVQQTTGGNAGAQTLAMEFRGPCLWAAGAADGDAFEGQGISGVSGWIMKMPS